MFRLSFHFVGNQFQNRQCKMKTMGCRLGQNVDCRLQTSKVYVVSSKLSRAFGILLLSITQILIHIWCYTCRDAPLVFNIWQPLCSLFVEHGCLLFFFKLTLASNVFLMQDFSVSVIARFLQVGKTLTKKNFKNLRVQKYLHG